MKFIRYSHWDQLPDSAGTLFEYGERESIFYSRPWFEAVTATLDDSQQLVLACVLDNDSVVALLPLVQSQGKSFYALKHRYTPHYSVLFAANVRQPVLACLVQGLQDLSIKALLLEPVCAEDDRLADLQQQLTEVGFTCEHAFRQYNWIYPLQGQSYDDYMAQRPARLRNTIARKQRKLQREHGYAIRLYTGAEVPAAMPDYYAAYRASWKANEQYTGFVDRVVAGFSRRGWTRLAVLYVGERPAAAQLWFVHHGKASIFRLAYDEAFKPYSPGSILMSNLMKYVIDTDRVHEIDFLMGNDAYKQDWMSRRRERLALSCINNVESSGSLDRFVAPLRRMLKRA